MHGQIEGVSAKGSWVSKDVYSPVEEHGRQELEVVAVSHFSTCPAVDRDDRQATQCCHCV